MSETGQDLEGTLKFYMSEYDKFFRENHDLRAELAEKEKQVENLNNIIKRGCEDEDSQCPQLERAEKLDAENAELWERMKPVEEVYKVLELSSEWQLIQAIKAACEKVKSESTIDLDKNK